MPLHFHLASAPRADRRQIGPIGRLFFQFSRDGESNNENAAHAAARAG
jgi:hypothetical protein